jgi:hypothetical protein
VRWSSFAQIARQNAFSVAERQRLVSNAAEQMSASPFELAAPLGFRDREITEIAERAGGPSLGGGMRFALRPDHELEALLADDDSISRLKHASSNERFPVHERAVRALQVLDGDRAAIDDEARVGSRNERVVQHDFALGTPPDEGFAVG